jgi:YVTN family beta-propeller protein
MGRKKGLIIAVSEYDNDYPLKYCEKDGIEVSKLLSSPHLAYEIEKKNKLIGRVKSEEMRDAIVDFFQNEDVRPEDMLLFYYSGHGIPDQGGKPYLSPSEIDPELPVKRGFSFNEFITVIQNSVSTKKVVILDCCFSGSAEIGKGKTSDSIQLITSIKEDSEEIEQGEGICILAASQRYQGAYPLEEQGHSIFTYYMLEGLRGNEESVDSNGNVTPYSLNRYISKKINSLPAEKRPRQKPLMRSETSGEITLASYPKKSPSQQIMPIPNSPTNSSEAAVHKGILRSKTKISIAISLTVVVLILATSIVLPSHHNTLLPAHQIIGKDPYDISVNPSTNTVYVANSGSNTVSVIDGKTNNVTTNIPVGTYPNDLSVNPSTNTIYVANRDDNTISVIDGKTNNVTANITVGERPWAVSVNPSTNMAYVANFYGDTVSVIDGKTNNVTANITVGKSPSDLSINPSTNIAYVSNYDNNTVSVIDGKTNHIIATIKVGTKPSAVSVNPSTNTVYVANQDDNTVSVIDGKTNNVTANITVGKRPNDLSVNRSTNTVYVANQDDNTVSVIDGKTNHIIATIKVGKDPLAVSVNPSTNVAYVANHGDNTVLVIDGKTNNVRTVK